jgi:D-lactate dehydrogenase
LKELLAESDIISLHCALTPETRHLLNKDTIALMKRGSMLINAARGGLIDTQAIIDALKTRESLGYLGIDVYEGEGPLFFADRSSTIIADDVFERLTTFPNVIVTGHQAFLTREALTQIAEIALGNAQDFDKGRARPENIVAA